VAAPAAQASAVKFTAERQLGLRVASAYPGHDTATRLLGEEVCHGRALWQGSAEVGIQPIPVESSIGMAPQPSRSRRLAWLRDELILALDLYMSEGHTAPRASRQALSDLLRAFPVEPELAIDPQFRSLASVNRKLANFLALDPNGDGGLERGGAGTRDVWGEFANDPQRVHRTADAIRANLAAGIPVILEQDDEVAEAEEGALLTGVHVRRERNARIVRQKKQKVVAETGALQCEVCNFEFAVAYGERGDGFIECHHLVALADLRPGSRTRLEDLALVCSNCHRMIHRRKPWLRPDELRRLIKLGDLRSAR
jgi:5-methylcytosine-specific restriction protein A